MPEINLTAAEATALIAMEKHRVNDTVHVYPLSGGGLQVPLVSADRRENFTLDIRRARIDLVKGTFQSRARQVAILMRLDFGGAPHRNPDDEEIPCPHLHIYREGYGDKWARPLSEYLTPIPTDRFDLLLAFMRLCNVTQEPAIDRNLFP